MSNLINKVKKPTPCNPKKPVRLYRKYDVNSIFAFDGSMFEGFPNLY